LDDYVKQESEEQKRKAISAVNAIVGIGYAAGPADTPTTSPARLSAPKGAAPVEHEDIPDLEAKPVAIDAELDDLLAEL